jgi:hypothetical protein
VGVITFVGALILTGFCFVSAPRLRQAWRGDRPFEPEFRWFGRRSTRDLNRSARSGVATLLSCYVMCVWFWALALSEVYDAQWFVVLTGFLFIALFATSACAATTYAYGRPRALVPPSLRSDGAV